MLEGNEKDKGEDITRKSEKWKNVTVFFLQKRRIKVKQIKDKSIKG